LKLRGQKVFGTDDFTLLFYNPDPSSEHSFYMINVNVWDSANPVKKIFYPTIPSFMPGSSH